MANFYFPKPQRQPKHNEIKIVEDINLINQGIEGKHPALESSEFFFFFGAQAIAGDENRAQSQNFSYHGTGE